MSSGTADCANCWARSWTNCRTGPLLRCETGGPRQAAERACEPPERGRTPACGNGSGSTEHGRRRSPDEGAVPHPSGFRSGGYGTGFQALVLRRSMTAIFSSLGDDADGPVLLVDHRDGADTVVQEQPGDLLERRIAAGGDHVVGHHLAHGARLHGGFRLSRAGRVRSRRRRPCPSRPAGTRGRSGRGRRRTRRRSRAPAGRAGCGGTRCGSPAGRPRAEDRVRLGGVALLEEVRPERPPLGARLLRGGVLVRVRGLGLPRIGAGTGPGGLRRARRSVRPPLPRDAGRSVLPPVSSRPGAPHRGW